MKKAVKQQTPKKEVKVPAGSPAAAGDAENNPQNGTHTEDVSTVHTNGHAENVQSPTEQTAQNVVVCTCFFLLSFFFFERK